MATWKSFRLDEASKRVLLVVLSNEPKRTSTVKHIQKEQRHVAEDLKSSTFWMSSNVTCCFCLCRSGSLC